MAKEAKKHSKGRRLAERYLSLLKKSLLDELYLENEARILLFVQSMFQVPPATLEDLSRGFLNIRNNPLLSNLRKLREKGNWIRFHEVTPEGKTAELENCRSFSFTAHTMIGRARMNNIHDCLNTIVSDDIPGDLIETGVWKGGATIFMRSFLEAHRIRDRKVWVADSFEGMPVPRHQKDQGFDLSKNIHPYLNISLEEVQELFERYELLDDQVCFLKGWFRDTLPNAPIKKLALLRLDGDLYESTMDALENLYTKLSPGGFIIVDDYFTFPQCKEAIDEFRNRHKIRKKLIQIDDQSMFWRKAH